MATRQLLEKYICVRNQQQSPKFQRPKQLIIFFEKVSLETWLKSM